MKILGIDPGIGICGFGLIEGAKLLDCGVITTPVRTPVPGRLAELYDGLMEIFETAKPDVVSVEKLFLPKISPPAFRSLKRVASCCSWPRKNKCQFLNTRQTKLRKLSPATALPKKAKYKRWLSSISALTPAQNRTTLPMLLPPPSHTL